MKKIKYNDIIEFLIGISLVNSVYANMIAYYLTGNKNEMLRKGISWGIIFAVAAVLVVYVIKKWITVDKVQKKKILVCLIPFIINAVFLLSGLIKSGGNSSVLKECITFGTYCTPVVCGAIYFILEKRFDFFVAKIKYITLTMTPFFLIAMIYLGSLKVDSARNKGIGGVVYLSIGYAAIVMYAGLLYDLILNLKNNRNDKKKILFILVEMVICSLMSVLSSSRGVLIAWFVINVVAILIMVLKKEKMAIGGCAISALFVVLFFVIAPADNMVLARQLSFVADIKQGKIEQSLKSEEGRELLEYFYEQADAEKGLLIIAGEIREEMNSNAEQDMVGNSSDKNATLESTENSENDQKYEDVVYSVTNGNMARSYLWQLAIKEMLQNPLTGMGVMNYQQKYGSYTHNIFLECLADFGILGLLIFGVVCVLTLVLLVKRAISDWKYCGILIFASGEFVHAVLSGNFYQCPFLLFVLTLAIGIFLDEYKKESV